MEVKCNNLNPKMCPFGMDSAQGKGGPREKMFPRKKMCPQG